MSRPSGDFTTLAKEYATNRPDYSETVLRSLVSFVEGNKPGFKVADVGAGTGIWSRMLAGAGLDVTAVEPNDAMREQGIVTSEGTSVSWLKGSGEVTNLDSQSVDWLTMASSFHWVEQPQGLTEFHRVLRPAGHLTVLWNPRNIAGHELHEGIEAMIHEMVPELKRVSSGSSKHACNYAQVLVSTGHFEDAIFFEAEHEICMSKERYMGAWRSVCDIQEQAGPERFAEILQRIEQTIEPLENVVVPYKTRAWTARRAELPSLG